MSLSDEPVVSVAAVVVVVADGDKVKGPQLVSGAAAANVVDFITERWPLLRINHALCVILHCGEEGAYPSVCSCSCACGCGGLVA